MKQFLLLCLMGLSCCVASAQQLVRGVVINRFTEEPVAFATLHLSKGHKHVTTDGRGAFELQLEDDSLQELRVSAAGFKTELVLLSVTKSFLEIPLDPVDKQLEEVVVSGTLKSIHRSSSPLPVETYPARFFKRTANNNLFDALSMINGVQPQLTCNVCNTGAIQINGLEGPYTMVLIDGMPVVSSLSSVYGFMGIPNSIIKRIEVVKGPASTLYGSEALAGVINIITKDPATKNEINAGTTVSSYGEVNTDFAANLRFKKASALWGVNHFMFQNQWDVNGDGFTDAALQNRISVFNKWSFERNNQLPATIAARYVYEDRWGGQLQWQKKYRGGNEVYGESIYTNRLELLGTYGIKIGNEQITADYSYNYHHQNSYYGTTYYSANQHVAFAQVRWNKQFKNHELLLGIPLRMNRYDDATAATQKPDGTNLPAVTRSVGLFVQDEWKLMRQVTLLAGMRYEHTNQHGAVFSPRLSLKLEAAENQTIRLTGGNGFRVVNLFTEDHAALTGARTVIIKNQLKPERSWNANINWLSHYHAGNGLLTLDANLFYTYFTNRIVADYFVNPEWIVYDNLSEHAVSRGISATLDYNTGKRLRINAGATFMNVYTVNEQKEKEQQLFAPSFTANYGIGYTIQPWRLTIDFTGRTQGSMRLPVLPNDYRPEYSPVYSLLNLQFAKKIKANAECMFGIQNLLNFLPKDPIMRPFDPFDKAVDDPVVNPFGYTFDPSYNYAPMMKRRVVIGLRWTFN